MKHFRFFVTLFLISISSSTLLKNPKGNKEGQSKQPQNTSKQPSNSAVDKFIADQLVTYKGLTDDQKQVLNKHLELRLKKLDSLGTADLDSKRVLLHNIVQVVAALTDTTVDPNFNIPDGNEATNPLNSLKLHVEAIIRLIDSKSSKPKSPAKTSPTATTQVPAGGKAGASKDAFLNANEINDQLKELFKKLNDFEKLSDTVQMNLTEFNKVLQKTDWSDVGAKRTNSS